MSQFSLFATFFLLPRVQRKLRVCSYLTLEPLNEWNSSRAFDPTNGWRNWGQPGLEGFSPQTGARSTFWFQDIEYILVQNLGLLSLRRRKGECLLVPKQLLREELPRHQKGRFTLAKKNSHILWTSHYYAKINDKQRYGNQAKNCHHFRNIRFASHWSPKYPREECGLWFEASSGSVQWFPESGEKGQKTNLSAGPEDKDCFGVALRGRGLSRRVSWAKTWIPPGSWGKYPGDGWWLARSIWSPERHLWSCLLSKNSRNLNDSNYWSSSRKNSWSKSQVRKILILLWRKG